MKIQIHNFVIFLEIEFLDTIWNFVTVWDTLEKINTSFVCQKRCNKLVFRGDILSRLSKVKAGMALHLV